MRQLRLAPLLALAVVMFLGAPASAGALTWDRGPGAQGDPTLQGVIDLPAAGSSLHAGRAFQVAGWVVDTTAQGWAGVDEAHLYVGRAGEGGTFLGRGLVAQSRPDVAAALGNPYWAASGFSFSVAANQLAAGTHTLTVYAHTPAKGWWSRSTTVSLVSPKITPETDEPATPASASASPNFEIFVIQPVANTEVRGEKNLIRGWAIDTNCATDTGVNKVEVYADGERGSSSAVFLGLGDYGKSYGSPDIQFGDERFARSGFDREWRPTDFESGDLDIYVYAHSACSDTWGVHKFKVQVAEEEE